MLRPKLVLTKGTTGKLAQWASLKQNKKNKIKKKVSTTVGLSTKVLSKLLRIYTLYFLSFGEWLLSRAGAIIPASAYWSFYCPTLTGPPWPEHPTASASQGAFCPGLHRPSGSSLSPLFGTISAFLNLPWQHLWLTSAAGHCLV